MLVGFLSSRDEQRRNCLLTGMPPTIPDLYSDPEVVAEYPYLLTHMQVYSNSLISRPSTATGNLYPEVSRAYFEAVHSVLTRKTSAVEAAAALQRNLVQITAFKAPATVGGTP
jgi:ABC-type glycerol-3-phosphate transport system substrate-binding protein